jgi:hypothetical protein
MISAGSKNWPLAFHQTLSSTVGRKSPDATCACRDLGTIELKGLPTPGAGLAGEVGEPRAWPVRGTAIRPDAADRPRGGTVAADASLDTGKDGQR